MYVSESLLGKVKY